MSDSFAEHPISIAERKASREHDCRKWLPRDALISVLRDIDDGRVNVSDIVIVYREKRAPVSGHATKFAVATSGGGVMALGMLQRAAHLINADFG